jgi:succinyl-CoA synthetase beta subunit
LGGEVVIKIQAWTTGRAGISGVAFAKKPEEARAHAERMLAMTVGQFPVEEKIAIDREFFLSFAIDDAARAQIRSGFGKRLTRNQIPDSMSP